MDVQTAPTPIRSAGRQALVLVIALLAMLVSVTPALAASTPTADATPSVVDDDLAPSAVAPVSTPDDTVDSDDLELTPPGTDGGQGSPAPGDTPEIEVAPDPPRVPELVLTPGCDPAGFGYGLDGPTLPKGSGVTIQWRKATVGPVHTVPTATEGFVASGQGHFNVRAVIFVDGRPVHRIDWTDVIVRCPTPRPEVTIDVAPTCDAGGGIDYQIHTESAPNGPLAYKAQWRALGGDIHTVEGQFGRIATGEGTFQIRGVLHHQGPGFFATDLVDVVVDCPDDVPDVPEDTPRPGIPTFTG